jgi:hypothetical protein
MSYCEIWVSFALTQILFFISFDHCFMVSAIQKESFRLKVILDWYFMFLMSEVAKILWFNRFVSASICLSQSPHWSCHSYRIWKVSGAGTSRTCTKLNWNETPQRGFGLVLVENEFGLPRKEEHTDKAIFGALCHATSLWGGWSHYGLPELANGCLVDIQMDEKRWLWRVRWGQDH